MKEHERSYPVRVVNMVAVATIAEKLDLDVICEQMREARYEPEVFPGLHWREPQTSLTTLLFHSGKVRITGATAEAQIRSALDSLVATLQLIGQRVNRSTPFKVVNVVGTVDLKGDIDLTKVVGAIGIDAEYEPEQFPGIIIRRPGDKRTCLLFSSGKMTIVGGTSEADLQEGAESMIRQLQNLDLIPMRAT